MAAGVFDGLVAVVTGGASGIGLATTRLLRAEGAAVTVLDVDQSDPDVVRCDVTDDAAVSRAIDWVVSDRGQLDIVVNAAGVGAQGAIDETDRSDWHRVFEVNVLGIVNIVGAGLPYLRASSAAAIVNVGSIAGWAGLPHRVAYSASKGAVHALTLAMAADHLADGIRVNAVAPGTTDTPWVQRLLAQADDPVAERQALADRQPLGRLVSAAEVAHAICHLASPATGATTGTILAVDGGMAGLRTRPRS